MPVPTPSDPPTRPPDPSQPSQKSMTKAERRELQEKQRAAKLLQKQTAATSGAAPPSTKSKQPSTPSQKKITGEAGGSSGSGTRTSMQRDVLNVGSTGVDDGAGASRGLRIFTHFGLPKPVGHMVKGDIHPAIVRLGLLFSEFRICGANARCIATLTAFKNV
jgi:translation initiation factor eIF-2B subunit delta